MKKNALGYGKSIFTSIFLTFGLLVFLTPLMLYPSIHDLRMLLASSTYLIFILVIAFLIYRTGKVSKYRSVFFSLFAISFVISFMPMMLESRGHIGLTEQDIQKLGVPLCHMVIPMLILPGFIHGVLIFPTKLLSPLGFYPMLFLWLVATVVLGKGWCSWACFFGGLDEFFSKLLPKRIISTKNFNYNWRLFPFAFLITIVLWALVAMEPVFCTWFCPFKAVTEFVKPTQLITVIQTVIFILLFTTLVIALPLLMKRRIQCGLFCPFGAFQALVGMINPYRVRVNPEKCSDCQSCIQSCPTFSITEGTLSKKKVSISCARCGHCMETCKQGAIDYALLGIPFSGRNEGLSKKPWIIRSLKEIFDPRSFYIFGALLFGGVFSNVFVSQALVRLFTLITKGSLLLR